MDHLALYSKKCKTCKHLDPEEVKEYTCHFTRGNADCPAQEIQFAVVGEAKRLAMLVKKARSAGDFEREVTVLTVVSKRTPAFQQKFREHLS